MQGLFSVALTCKGWKDRAETSGILLYSKLQEKFIIFLLPALFLLCPSIGINCPLEDNNITIRGMPLVRRCEEALVLRQSAHKVKN